MSYVEWLRVRNCLIGVGCTMAVIILIALTLRIVFNAQITGNDSFISKISMESGTKISHTTLPDGAPRTLIVSPSDRTTITVDGGGSAERHITIVEPATNSRRNDDNFTMGSVQVRSTVNGTMKTTTVNTDGPTPIWFYFMFGTVVSLIVATILGAPFARENDGHLEIAALRPRSRLELALRTVGVDLAGIVLSSLVTVVALVICQLMFEVPHFAIDDATLQIIGISIMAPFAWYALIAAATSSMKRAYGAVVGFAWPIAILVAVFGMLPWNDSVLGQLMHNVFGTLQWIDPLKYASLRLHVDETTGMMQPSADILRSILFESILFVVYGALAIFQWQKVEA